MPRLRKADCSGPGILRRRRGRGFEYLDEDGERVDDAETVERIRDLVIPPAWSNVWICPYPNGHIQAVGSDAAGRRQYLYHADWRRRRDREKFDERVRFAGALPGIRAAAAAHLRKRGLPRERVLACSVRLLDRGFFRIGTEDYAESNGTYGLATMRRSHVTLGPEGLIRFDYPAKGGKRRVQSVVDRSVYRVVETLKRRAGPGELLAYQVDGEWVDVTSDEINAYIKELAQDSFSAKDFRTWNATVLAAVALAVSGQAHGTKTGRRRAISRAVQ
jgi:DNA topoisomerase I